MPVSRRRSCAACRVGKARCSLTLPICIRCKSKRLQCEYGTNRPDRDPESSDSWLRDGGAYLAEESASNEISADPEILNTAFRNTEPLQGTSNHTPEFREVVRDHMELSWNSPNPITGGGGTRPSLGKTATTLGFITEDRDPGAQPQTTQQNSSQDPNLPSFQFGHPSYDTDILQHILEGNNLTDIQIPNPDSRTLTTTYPEPATQPRTHPNFLYPKKSPTLGSSLTSKYLLSVFDSYPRLFCEKNLLPPYVHSRFPGDDMRSNAWSRDLSTQVPEPLAICRSLLHMYYGRSAASGAYVWRTISGEQQRVYAEFSGYDRWTLLCSLQAITIYLTLQMSEEQHDPDASFMLVVTMGEIAAKLFSDYGYYSGSEAKGNFPSWEDWIFAESSRRIMMLLFMMEMLRDINIDVRPPKDCTGMDSVPLPCSERMWRADTRAAWEECYKEYLSSRKGNGLLKYGALRESYRLDTSVMDKASVEDLERWCTAVDGFGALLMTVARGV